MAILDMQHCAIEAGRRLKEEDISVEMIAARTLAPLDRETILDSVRKTGRPIAVDEAVLSCSIQGQIIASVTEEAFPYLKAPPVCFETRRSLCLSRRCESKQ